MAEAEQMSSKLLLDNSDFESELIDLFEDEQSKCSISHSTGMSECKKFDVGTQTYSESVQRDVEALSIVLNSGIISRDIHDKRVLSLHEETNIVQRTPHDTSKKNKLHEKRLQELNQVEEETSIVSTIIVEASKTDSCVICNNDSSPTKESTVNQANDERMNAMEKRMQELSEHCAKLESLVSPDENKDSNMYPDLQKIYNSYIISRFAKDSRGIDTKYLLPCSVLGMRCWQAGLGRVFDYTTYEYIGKMQDRIPTKFLVNPVYAVKYKENYPDLYDLCIVQKKPMSLGREQWPEFCQVFCGGIDGYRRCFTSLEVIKDHLDEDLNLHEKIGVYSLNYKESI